MGHQQFAWLSGIWMVECTKYEAPAVCLGVQNLDGWSRVLSMRHQQFAWLSMIWMVVCTKYGATAACLVVHDMDGRVY